MNQTPHKHAAIIKAWADGADVEYRILGQTEFYGQPCPGFNGVGEYRIKPAPDKWADLKAAHKAGIVIEFRDVINAWVTVPAPTWATHEGAEYRLAPHDEYAALRAAAESGKTIQYRLGENFAWNDAPVSNLFGWGWCVTNYRVKPETLSYRVAILQYEDGASYACICHKPVEEKMVEGRDVFVRWLGDRQEVEV